MADFSSSIPWQIKFYTSAFCRHFRTFSYIPRGQCRKLCSFVFTGVYIVFYELFLWYFILILAAFLSFYLFCLICLFFRVKYRETIIYFSGLVISLLNKKFKALLWVISLVISFWFWLHFFPLVYFIYFFFRVKHHEIIICLHDSLYFC